MLGLGLGLGLERGCQQYKKGKGLKISKRPLNFAPTACKIMIDGGGAYTVPTRFIVTDMLVASKSCSIEAVRDEIHHQSSLRLKEIRPLYMLQGIGERPDQNWPHRPCLEASP